MGGYTNANGQWTTADQKVQLRRAKKKIGKPDEANLQDKNIHK